MKKLFGSFNEFPSRDVELYRSSDYHNTAIYFTDVEYENRKAASAFFELLKFDFLGGPHQIYIRFPNQDFFTEIFKGGFGSGRGDMTIAHGKNIWSDKYSKKITIHQHPPNLLLSFGQHVPEFNFMKRVAYSNSTDKHLSNYEELKNILTLPYLKLPDNVRKVEYFYQFKRNENKYIIVDYPAFNFQYNNHRLFLIDNLNIQEYTIKSFTRYRDGGTTFIKAQNNVGEMFQLFCPTKLGDNIKKPTWNTTEELQEVVSQKTRSELLSLLKIIEEEIEEEE